MDTEKELIECDYTEENFGDGTIVVYEYGKRNVITETEIIDDFDGISLSHRHTSIKVYNPDFPVDDEADEVGEVCIIPARIVTITEHEDKPGYTLINLKHGASYWIKKEDQENLYIKEE
jgi:hypothetical protein